jgi:hypothetical protein
MVGGIVNNCSYLLINAAQLSEPESLLFDVNHGKRGDLLSWNGVVSAHGGIWRHVKRRYAWIADLVIAPNAEQLRACRVQMEDAQNRAAFALGLIIQHRPIQKAPNGCQVCEAYP